MAQKKSIVFFSYMIACAMFPSSLSAEINFIKYDPFFCGGGIMSHKRPYQMLNQQASICAFLLRYFP